MSDYARFMADSVDDYPVRHMSEYVAKVNGVYLTTVLAPSLGDAFELVKNRNRDAPDSLASDREFIRVWELGESIEQTIILD